MSTSDLDMIPRYTPSQVMTLKGHRPVLAVIAHNPNNHPKACPLIRECTALELKTSEGSRWYGCQKAWINSELRMVAQGFPARFEEMAKWETCTRV